MKARQTNHAIPPAQAGEDTPLYTPIASYESLRKVLDDKLTEYNDTNTVRAKLEPAG